MGLDVSLIANEKPVATKKQFEERNYRFLKYCASDRIQVTGTERPRRICYFKSSSNSVALRSFANAITLSVLPVFRR